MKTITLLKQDKEINDLPDYMVPHGFYLEKITHSYTLTLAQFNQQVQHS